MKKIIAFIICAALTFGISETSFAATEVTSAPATAETEIVRTIESEYSVLIPKTITIASAETTKEFEIQAKGNLSATKQIDVTYASATIDMEREGDDTYDDLDAILAFDNDISALTWTEDNTSADAYSSQVGIVSFAETKAGEYSGTATFHISLNDRIQ